MVQVDIIYHSNYGHTEQMAKSVYEGAASVEDVSARLVTVAEATEDLDSFDSADAIIFGCPTYMGSMSADMKAFQEVAAKKWFTQAWKDKVAGAFTNSSSFSGDKLNTLVGLMLNAMQHSMIYVGLGMMPSANDPEGMNSPEGPGPHTHNRVGSFAGPMAASFQLDPAEAPPVGDRETAIAYGVRVATLTKQIRG